MLEYGSDVNCTWSTGMQYTVCHEILGCDTTSFLHGVGKKIGLKLISTNKIFFEQAQVFSKQNSTRAEVIAAEEKALVQIYKGLPGGSIET